MEHSSRNSPEGSSGPADLAITGCTALVGFDGDTARFVADSTITIRGNRIERIGPAVGAPAAAEAIDARGLVAMPGLINTHCHAAMTLLRGAAEDVVLDDWFNDYIWPMEVNVGEPDVHVGTLLAAAEMIEGGITTVVDHYFFMQQAAQAIVESGMRANLGSAFFSSQGQAGLEQSVAFAEEWNGRANGRIVTAVAPHAPYTVTDEHLIAAADEARRLGVKVHVHAAEDIMQTHKSLEVRGITPIEVLHRTGVLDAGAIVAHGNGVVDSDLAALAKYAGTIGFTHGPKGYLKFAVGPVTPIAELFEIGVDVGYCTDGAASNNSLDILEAMRICTILQKQLKGDGTWFPSGAALRMAGPRSATVAGLGGQVGELREGALADVILVDVSGFHCQPVHDLSATLVHSIHTTDVRTTIVDGRVLMRDRELLTIDRAALIDEFRARAAVITDRSHGRRIQDYDAH